MADTLLHLNNSQSQTVLWLLEELGVPYNLNLMVRETSGPRIGRAPESLKETHPLGKSPQLATPQGRVIVERTAIMLYLIDAYDEERHFQIPADNKDPENDAIREQMIIGFGESTFGSRALLTMTFQWMKELSPFFVKYLAAGVGYTVNKAYLGQEMINNLKYVDAELEGRNYFMGQQNPTRADFIMMWYIDLVYLSKAIDIAPYRNLKRWHDRCIARPAWKRAIAKGNGYDSKHSKAIDPVPSNSTNG